jgi:hypothetical protein
MDFLTKKHMSRRTVLRGLGVTMALPVLDAMSPAATAFAKTTAAAKKVRLSAIEMVHGSAGATQFGLSKNLVVAGRSRHRVRHEPGRARAARALPRLPDDRQQHRRQNAEAFSLPEIGADHFRSSAVFLTQSHPKKTQGSDVLAGTSLDQLYAQKFGQDTAIPSMQLSIETVDQSGGCAYGYSCAYTDSISWATPEQPLPMIRDPRAVFDSLFGVGATPAERAQSRRADKSILDWVSSEVSRLSKELGLVRSPAPQSVPDRDSRDRAPHPEDRSAEQQRRSARAAGRAGRRAR